MKKLYTNLTAKKTKLAVVGLGYVGLPLAVEFGKHYPTIGFDINNSRVNELIGGHDSLICLAGTLDVGYHAADSALRIGAGLDVTAGQMLGFHLGLVQQIGADYSVAVAPGGLIALPWRSMGWGWDWRVFLILGPEFAFDRPEASASVAFFMRLRLLALHTWH